jgi:cardiolipin synthase (CMP-forming)
MLAAKQVADLITLSRGLMAFVLAGLGLLLGQDALPLAAVMMIADWCGDVMDGPIARRSKVYQHTWIGDHDLQVDMSVSVGLLIYLLTAGYVSWWLGAAYLVGWTYFFLKVGLMPAPGMLFQAPTYFWFIWIVVRESPWIGSLIILFILAIVILTWPRFPRVVVPGFLRGMKDALGRIKNV